MNPHELSERLDRLETAIAHYQRDFDTLNSVVVEQANTIDRLQREAARLRERVESLQAASDSSPGRLEDERPPHY